MLSLTIIPISQGDLARLNVFALARMYIRWAERNNYPYKITCYPMKQGAGQVMPTDLNHGDIGGSKWEVVHIDAPHELLQGENGIHQFRQVSPLDAQARVHVTFVSVTATWADTSPSDPIRSYDFVKDKATDLRTHESANLQLVMNGEYLLGVETVKPAPKPIPTFEEQRAEFFQDFADAKKRIDAHRKRMERTRRN